VIQPKLSIRKPDWQAAIKGLAVTQRERARLVLESVNVEIVAWLKSHTDKRRPPVRYRGAWTGERPAHPGGWADISTLLVNSYSGKVTEVPNGARLTLANTAEYAVYLEARDGFFVLSGVLEPGGEFERAMIEIIRAVAPGWKYRTQGTVSGAQGPRPPGA
jgi:hypothetical protein